MNRVPVAFRWTAGIAFALLILWQMLSVYGGNGIPPSFRGGMRSVDSARHTERKVQVADSLTLALHKRPSSPRNTFAADIDFTNHSAATVSDLIISCDALGDLGGILGRTTASVHQVLPAHSTIAVPNVQLPFSVQHIPSVRCSIAGFTIRA